jgi:hypothetical protein
MCWCFPPFSSFGNFFFSLFFPLLPFPSLGRAHGVYSGGASVQVGDLALNCSYIVLHYGRLFVGRENDPFMLYTATITLVGSRDSYELPVYGAKTLAVRTAEVNVYLKKCFGRG